jgi:hypothetical protein
MKVYICVTKRAAIPLAPCIFWSVGVSADEAGMEARQRDVGVGCNCVNLTVDTTVNPICNRPELEFLKSLWGLGTE